MSVETDPLPPVPEHTPPLQEDNGKNHPGKSFNHTWTRWFVSLREKINVINDQLTTLGQLIGGGFIVVDGNTVAQRTIQGTSGRISVTNGDGIGGDPTIDLTTAGVVPGTYGSSSDVPVITVDAFGRITAISTVPVSGGGGTTYSGWLTSSLPPDVSASNLNFKLTRSSGSNGVRGVYHTVARNTGKYALRFLLLSTGASVQGPAAGVLSGSIGSYLGATATGIGFWPNSSSVNERTFRNSSATAYGDLASFTSDTEVMIEIDLDAGKVWFGVAGTFVGGGNPSAGTGETYSFTPGAFYAPCADMYYMGTVELLTPSDFITPASTGFTPGWPD